MSALLAFLAGLMALGRMWHAAGRVPVAAFQRVARRRRGSWEA